MQHRSTPPHLWTPTTIPHQPLFIVPRRLQYGFSAGTELRSPHTLRHRTVSVSALYRMVLAGLSPPLSCLLLRALGNQRHFHRAPPLDDCRRLSRAQYRYRRWFASLAPLIERLFIGGHRRTLHSHSCCAFKSSDTATAADTAAFSSSLISQALLFAAYRATTSFRRLLREHLSSPLLRESRTAYHASASFRALKLRYVPGDPPLLGDYCHFFTRRLSRVLLGSCRRSSLASARLSDAALRAFARLGNCRSSSASRSFRRLALLSPSIRSFRPLSPLKSRLLLARSVHRRSLLHSLRTPASFAGTVISVDGHGRILRALSLRSSSANIAAFSPYSFLSALFSPHPSRSLSW
jgi:hypothetical protein